MFLYAVFYAEYAYIFCWVVLAHLSCKLSLVSMIEADSIQMSIHALKAS